jgi:hypothetical protein
MRVDPTCESDVACDGHTEYHLIKQIFTDQHLIRCFLRSSMQIHRNTSRTVICESIIEPPIQYLPAVPEQFGFSHLIELHSSLE